MHSRHCKKCVADWPMHHVSCPICQTTCTESSKQPMDESEYKWMLATLKGRFPPLTKTENDRVSAEWLALDTELARRGEFWTLADLIGENFSVRATS